MTEPQPKKTRSLPDDDGERISITDINGTIARFEMSYSPKEDEHVRFMAPLRQRVPSIVFLALALVFGVIVILAYKSPNANGLFRWIVEGDRTGRPLPSQAFGILMVCCAAATVLRAHMRGIVIGPDWIVVRTLLPLGIPHAKRWGWPQVHRIIVDKKALALELMDGSFNTLPVVQDPLKLRDVLFVHASRRKIQVTLLEKDDAAS